MFCGRHRPWRNLPYFRASYFFILKLVRWGGQVLFIHSFIYFLSVWHTAPQLFYTGMQVDEMLPSWSWARSRWSSITFWPLLIIWVWLCFQRWPSQRSIEESTSVPYLHFKRASFYTILWRPSTEEILCNERNHERTGYHQVSIWVGSRSAWWHCGAALGGWDMA